MSNHVTVGIYRVRYEDEELCNFLSINNGENPTRTSKKSQSNSMSCARIAMRLNKYTQSFLYTNEKYDRISREKSNVL